MRNPKPRNKKPIPNFTDEFGSSLFFAILISNKPISGANRIMNREFAELFTVVGLIFNPNNECCRLLFANNESEPPACSKIAQKTTENKINNKAPNNFLFSLIELLLIS